MTRLAKQITDKMISKLTLIALVVITIAQVYGGPAPNVFYLKISGSYKRGGKNIVVYDQGGYQQRVDAFFGGANVNNKCQTVKYYYSSGRTVIGWRKQCTLQGSGNFVVKTPFGRIRGKNYDQKFIS